MWQSFSCSGFSQIHRRPSPTARLRIADACQDSPLITLTACRDLAAHVRLSLRSKRVVPHSKQSYVQNETSSTGPPCAASSVHAIASSVRRLTGLHNLDTPRQPQMSKGECSPHHKAILHSSQNNTNAINGSTTGIVDDNWEHLERDKPRQTGTVGTASGICDRQQIEVVTLLRVMSRLGQ